MEGSITVDREGWDGEGEGGGGGGQVRARHGGRGGRERKRDSEVVFRCCWEY